MKTIVSGLVALSVLTGFVGSASAQQVQQDNAQTDPCPTGHRQMDSLCLNSATGDVVLAAPTAPSDGAASSR